MALFSPTFKDITYKSENMTAKIHLAFFGGRFKKAQRFLDTEIMRLMEPVMPRRTGAFISRIKSINAGRVGTGVIQTSVPPQGRRLYGGVNPTTGIPYRWTNPNTQPYWGQWVIQNYGHELTQRAKEIIGGKG